MDTQIDIHTDMDIDHVPVRVPLVIPAVLVACVACSTDVGLVGSSLQSSKCRGHTDPAQALLASVSAV